MNPDPSWAALVEENLIAYFQHIARARPSGRLAELDGVLIASAGTRFHMFNAAFLSRPVGGGEPEFLSKIATAGEWLGGAGQGWAFWLCEDKSRVGSASRLRALFRQQGMEFAYRHPGMAARALRPADSAPGGLTIRPVNTRETRAAFSHINAVAFRAPFEWCRELYDIEELWGGDLAGWVGYRNGTAVSSASALIHGGAAGLYAVATLPEFERQGFGEAMVRHAVQWAAEERGAKISVLQSTREGEKLYHRLGYQTVTHFSVFTS